MTIREILSRKLYLDKKLEDITNYIEELSNISIPDKAAVYNKAVEYKFSLLSKIQSHKVLLQSQNNVNSISIGDNELSVHEAIKLRNTAKAKLETLDTIIRKGDFGVINTFNLMQQRDVLFEEFILLDLAIVECDTFKVWEKDQD